MKEREMEKRGRGGGKRGGGRGDNKFLKNSGVCLIFSISFNPRFHPKESHLKVFPVHIMLPRNPPQTHGHRF